MNPPAVVIRIELERRAPLVVGDYMTDGDEARIRQWLERRSALADLIRRATELADRERAA